MGGRTGQHTTVGLTAIPIRPSTELMFMGGIDLGSLNYLAIIVGIIADRGVRYAAWYGASTKPWMAEVGFTQEFMVSQEIRSARQWYPYVIAVVSALVFTFVLTLLIQGDVRGKRSRRPHTRPLGIHRIHFDVIRDDLQL